MPFKFSYLFRKHELGEWYWTLQKAYDLSYFEFFWNFLFILLYEKTMLSFWLVKLGWTDFVSALTSIHNLGSEQFWHKEKAFCKKANWFSVFWFYKLSWCQLLLGWSSFVSGPHIHGSEKWAFLPSPDRIAHFSVLLNAPTRHKSRRPRQKSACTFLDNW